MMNQAHPEHVPPAETPDDPLVTESELERRDLLRSVNSSSPWAPVLVAGGLITVLGLAFTDAVMIAFGSVILATALVIRALRARR